MTRERILAERYEWLLLAKKNAEMERKKPKKPTESPAEQWRRIAKENAEKRKKPTESPVEQWRRIAKENGEKTKTVKS